MWWITIFWRHDNDYTYITCDMRETGDVWKSKLGTALVGTRVCLPYQSFSAANIETKLYLHHLRKPCCDYAHLRLQAAPFVILFVYQPLIFCFHSARHSTLPTETVYPFLPIKPQKIDYFIQGSGYFLVHSEHLRCGKAQHWPLIYCIAWLVAECRE